MNKNVFAINILIQKKFLKISQAASPRWEPQIAVLCEAGQSYHPQHLSEEGRWTTDLNIKTPGTTCLRDKMDLLEHCKKVCRYFHRHSWFNIVKGFIRVSWMECTFRGVERLCILYTQIRYIHIDTNTPKCYDVDTFEMKKGVKETPKKHLFYLVNPFQLLCMCVYMPKPTKERKYSCNEENWDSG